MALNYLSGDEQPTAAKMNELWAEADSVINKALKGGSTYLLENIGASSNSAAYPDSKLFRGKEFTFWQGATHSASSTSVLYSAFDTIPTTYNQPAYDTAASNATIATYSSDGYAHVAGSSTPNLTRSLKAHTRTHNGQEYYIWEYDQPAPEKKWEYAVAEIIIGMQSGTTFSMPDSYDKYSCWRIHNATNRDYTISCGSFSDPHATFTIPAYGQKCVRRVGTTFHHDYKYFFKCLSGDPRFLFFDSFEGSIAQTMRANNITNPSYVYNLFEFVGMDFSPLALSNTTGDRNQRHQQRIYFNPTTKNDVGSEMATDGHFPAINDSTKIVDLVYHKGKIGYRKKDTSSSTLEVGEIDFDGWSSFGTNLAAIDAALASTGISNNRDTKIATSATPSELKIWPVSTNVLQLYDENGVMNLASTFYYLQTHFLFPPSHGSVPRLFNRYFFALMDIASSASSNPANPTSESYNGTTADIQDLKDYLSGSNYQSNSTPESKSVALTSEGPFLYWTDKFDVASGTDADGWFSGFSTNHGMRLETVSGVPKLLIDQEWFIPLRLQSAGYVGSSAKAVATMLIGYGCGWPSHWKDSSFNAITSDARHHIDSHLFHRMHEGPRKTRRYETATPITVGTETFKHNDIKNDPVGQAGADLEQNDIGTLTDTDIAFLTNDIDLKVSKGSFSGGEVNNPNYPRAVVDDKIKEAQDSKSAASLNEIKTLSDYNRLNLLKEHYNNIAVHIKKADKIRPLTIDEIYFGNRKMKPNQGWFRSEFAPIDCFEGFVDGDDQDDLYTDLGITVRTKDDFDQGSTIFSAASTGTNTITGNSEEDDLDAFRWVKISDVQTFAASEGLGFRFEELATPATFHSTHTQSVGYTGGTLTLSNVFVAGETGTGHKFKIVHSGGQVIGSKYSLDFQHLPESNSESETLGESFFRKFATFYDFNLKPAMKAVSQNSDGSSNFKSTGMVIQCIDSTRTTSTRAKLALKPLKQVQLVVPSSGISNAYGQDFNPSASSSLTNINADTTFIYPSETRHRYAYLLNVTAPETHSA